MQRNHKTEEHKRLRRIWNEYITLADARHKSGEWIEVEPYQRGWIRYYILRDDAKNRKDARELQQVLDKINTMIFCNNEKFLHRNWKTNKWEPIPQKPKYLTQQQYDDLSEKHKSFFVKREWVETVKVGGMKHRTTVVGYIFFYDYYLVLHKEPNIVTHHWIPDQELESRYGELRESMHRNNVWAKLNKAINWNTGHNRGWKDDVPHKYRNNTGFEFESIDE